MKQNEFTVQLKYLPSRYLYRKNKRIGAVLIPSPVVDSKIGLGAHTLSVYLYMLAYERNNAEIVVLTSDVFKRTRIKTWKTIKKYLAECETAGFLEVVHA